MTRFTVVWTNNARGRLADLWMNAANRNAIQSASDRIDMELANNASTKGDEVSEGLRKLHVPPLKVIFTVRDDDRIVEVLSVLIL